MPDFTILEAVDAMYGLFTDAWNAQADPPALLYDDFGQDLPNTDQAWARIQIRHNDGGQATLGEEGVRKFERIGIITVQVFTPLNDGRTTSDNLVQLAMRAFEGKTAGGDDGVWFRNVRANEIGRSGGWYQVNVLAEFEYDFRQDVNIGDVLLIDDTNNSDALLIDDLTQDLLLVE